MTTRKVRAGQPAPDIEWPEPEIPAEVDETNLIEEHYTVLTIVICSVLLVLFLVYQVV